VEKRKTAGSDWRTSVWEGLVKLGEVMLRCSNEKFGVGLSRQTSSSFFSVKGTAKDGLAEEICDVGTSSTC